MSMRVVLSVFAAITIAIAAITAVLSANGDPSGSRHDGVPRIRWIRVAALLTAVGGTAVGLVAFGSGYVTSGGIDPIIVRTPAFYRRMWTIVLSLAIAGILLIVDALRHVDDE